jgi:hypothetical protein
MWRPRKQGNHFRVHVELWDNVSSSIREAIREQAERLAAHRQVPIVRHRPRPSAYLTEGFRT